MGKIYIVVGVPGSGKSWVCQQLTKKYTYLPKDSYINDNNYLQDISYHAKTFPEPILMEANFSVNVLKEPLESKGYTVIPLFIVEDPITLSRRYKDDPKRTGGDIPKGHLTRNETYSQRAKDWNAFVGTSDEVLEYLKNESN